MNIQMRNINEIHPYENNPRVNDKAVESVTASLKEFGFRQPSAPEEFDAALPR